MSDNWVVFIPSEPEFVPSPHAQIAARDLVKSWAPEADEIESAVTDAIEFVDAGANASTVLCPVCGAALDPEWAYDSIGAAHNKGFSDLIVLSPCCGSTISLNELIWDWPQGFARFQLAAMNPNFGRVSDAQVGQLEAVVGTPIRVIYRHL
jgi:hypothetical protein